jgi:hypothetical protein
MAAVAESPVAMATVGDEPPLEVATAAATALLASWPGRVARESVTGWSGVVGLRVSAPYTRFG